MTDNSKTAERKIDKEIVRRIGDLLYVYHIKDVGTRVHGLTVVARYEEDHVATYAYINAVIEQRREVKGDVFSGDIKNALSMHGYGVAVCDATDQFSRQEGRTRAKRNWLKTHPR